MYTLLIILSSTIVIHLLRIDFTTHFYASGIALIGVFLIVIYLLYLFSVAAYSSKYRLRDYPLFFISSVFLVYQAFNTVIFVFMNILDAEALSFLWKFRYISNIILNLTIASALFYYGRNKLR